LKSLCPVKKSLKYLLRALAWVVLLRAWHLLWDRRAALLLV
jgi:hypothetical protein